MDRPVQLLPALCPIELGNEDGGPRGHTGEKVHRQPQEGVDRVDGGQPLLSRQPPHNDGVGGGVQLLEQASQQDGKEEGQQGPPDGPLCHVQGFLSVCHMGFSL